MWPNAGHAYFRVKLLEELLLPLLTTHKKKSLSTVVNTILQHLSANEKDTVFASNNLQESTQFRANPPPKKTFFSATWETGHVMGWTWSLLWGRAAIVDPMKGTFKSLFLSFILSFFLLWIVSRLLFNGGPHHQNPSPTISTRPLPQTQSRDNKWKILLCLSLQFGLDERY